ncbi:hypothetical protein M9H77_26238 [Catharanthus roseus]|uniref:Uncharacterized protein n=1 Tax=Catharanthus roseus TaxID=4058 RepID=A0ACC0A977_CATRO|nr:hypothetical protein M9H77_26238 [Catharanthus roseus]
MCENWQLFVHDGRHNQAIGVYSHGHAQAAKLTEEQLIQLSNSGRVMCHPIIFYDFSGNKMWVVLYNMPLLKVVGMTPTSKNFTVASAFMRNEQATMYRWVLQ